jgi:hypothetical protein
LTQTLSKYTSTCGLSVADLIFTFTSNSLDMDDYSWFTVNKNKFIVTPSAAPAATYPVKVTASYYISAEAASVTSEFLLDFNLIIKPLNTAPVITGGCEN